MDLLSALNFFVHIWSFHSTGKSSSSSSFSCQGSHQKDFCSQWVTLHFDSSPFFTQILAKTDNFGPSVTAELPKSSTFSASAGAAAALKGETFIEKCDGWRLKGFPVFYESLAFVKQDFVTNSLNQIRFLWLNLSSQQTKTQREKWSSDDHILTFWVKKVKFSLSTEWLQSRWRARRWEGDDFGLFSSSKSSFLRKRVTARLFWRLFLKKLWKKSKVPKIKKKNL